jgi:tRNA threonylcarbamoyl adenosine modification protein (Sua5/YciO/YrdC/YwlC family)
MSPQEALVAGKVIAVPTDTVYGLACLPDKSAAVARIYGLKQRGRDLPLPILCTDLRQAALYGRLPEWAGRGWPGPVTLIVRRTMSSTPWDIGDDPDSIGLRVPDHPLVRGLADELGPLAVTSANLHGEQTPRTAEGVLDLFGEDIEMVVDGGRLGNAPSTVVDCRVAPPRVVRPGSVRLSTLLN